MDPNSELGENGLHPRLLKKLAHLVAVPLTIIFKAPLQTRCLPSHWLTSLVIPLYKEATSYDPLSYRPVSITSVPCKVPEILVVEHLNAYLNDNLIISDDQFGFRGGRSTEDQLLLI